jgi:hypothetical protein
MTRTYTMRLCRGFMLQVEADRLEKLLVRYTIRSAPLIMEDVDMIWEVWKRDFRAPPIVDVLWCYILYDLFNKDIKDAAEIRMLLEEFFFIPGM